MLSAKSYAKFFGESLLEEIFHLDEELLQVIANKKDPLVEEELENAMDIALVEAETEAQKILDEAKTNYHVYSAFGGQKLSSHSTEDAAHKAAAKHSMKIPVHVWSAKGGEFGIGKPIAHWDEGKKTVYENYYENEIHSMMETALAMSEDEIQKTKPKKILALDPKEREKECKHEHTPYSGSVPCTGSRRCTMCGTVVEDELPEDAPISVNKFQRKLREKFPVKPIKRK